MRLRAVVVRRLLVPDADAVLVGAVGGPQWELSGVRPEQGLEVVVAVKGSDVPLLLTGFTAIPVVVDVQRSVFIVEATSLPEGLLLRISTAQAASTSSLVMSPSTIAIRSSMAALQTEP